MKKNKKKKAIVWIIGFLVISVLALSAAGYCTIKVDPFFHYHKPNTQSYYYELNNERSQNNGIVRHFDYDAIITGTSMCQNFKASLFDELFSCKSVKVTFAGATYKEINDNLVKALNYNPDVKTVIRSVDVGMLFKDKDEMRNDLGDYPTYLFDNNIFNDVKYIFNRDVLLKRAAMMMVTNNDPDFKGGITSFDEYSNWMGQYTFGVKSICTEEVHINKGQEVSITEEERQTVLENIRQNVTDIARKNPDVQFYLFLPPYSALWWSDKVADGTLKRQIEAEKIAIEEMLSCGNIKLFAFDDLTDMVSDLNNYKDKTHYGIWVNDLIFYYMKDEKCLLTKDNYEAYLDRQYAFYDSFDYESFNSQEDYEDDAKGGQVFEEKYLSEYVK